MKNLFKGVAYFVFRLFSGIKTTRFSHFLVSWGYTIKSEALYNKADVKAFPDRIDMHRYLVSQHLRPEDKIFFMEFGVYKGETYFIWVEGNKNPESRFAGFDTFTGLPEDWGSVKAGSFSAGGKLPETSDPRSKFQVGLIQDTLPVFAPSLTGKERKVVHIDVDLYNASMITLVLLQPYLRKGDMLIFDDFFTFTKATHEFKAFDDFFTLYPLSYRPLYKCRGGHLVVEITSGE
ncbi:MAG TPA: class I SAM-dependent methyltransferase [Puia sp.]|nr:class I SAM-dependent methyltransferase [Puia sp.]